jgi:hypothetical protein
VLLLEKDSPPHGCYEIAKEIERAASDFADLKRIDEIWVANTVAWETEGDCSFVVWPEELRGYAVKEEGTGGSN